MSQLCVKQGQICPIGDLQLENNEFNFLYRKNGTYMPEWCFKLRQNSPDDDLRLEIKVVFCIKKLKTVSVTYMSHQ